MIEIIERSLDLFFPIDEKCAFCNKRKKVNLHNLCEQCYTELDREFRSCRYCGIPLGNYSANECEDCLFDDRDIDYFIKSYAISPITKRALRRYKECNDRGISYTLASIMAERVREVLDSNQIDLIVPVPSSKKKIKIRGFDQVKEIAKRLSNILEVDYEVLLERKYEGRDQKVLNRKDRLDIITQHFSLKKSVDVPIRILLVDDVVTTGSTMRACARVLRPLKYEIYGICAFHSKQKV